MEACGSISLSTWHPPPNDGTSQATPPPQYHATSSFFPTSYFPSHPSPPFLTTPESEYYSDSPGNCHFTTSDRCRFSRSRHGWMRGFSMNGRIRLESRRGFGLVGGCWKGC